MAMVGGGRRIRVVSALPVVAGDVGSLGGGDGAAPFSDGGRTCFGKIPTLRVTTIT